jgi:hypothetical protein
VTVPLSLSHAIGLTDFEQWPSAAAMRADGCPSLGNRPEMNMAILTVEFFGLVVKSLEAFSERI